MGRWRCLRGGVVIKTMMMTIETSFSQSALLPRLLHEFPTRRVHVALDDGHTFHWTLLTHTWSAHEFALTEPSLSRVWKLLKNADSDVLRCENPRAAP